MSEIPSETRSWAPPAKVEELFHVTAGNKFASINRPTAGARTEEAMPVGDASFQLYSLSTPNGQKVGIMLEELGIEYDAWKISLSGDQFKSGFVEINPNSKIPAAVDKDGSGGKVVNLFESGSIILYLAEKYQRFIPSDPAIKAEVMNWVFWQMGSQGPVTGMGFGHFFAYAPADKIEARDYAVARFGMEVQRICSVLDIHLASRTYMVNEEYSIADIIIYPWAAMLRKGAYSCSGVTCDTFLSMEQYIHLNAWLDRISARPAVQRGLQVCSWASEHTKPWLVAEKEDAEKGPK